MEFPLISRAPPNPGMTAFSSCKVGFRGFPVSLKWENGKKGWFAGKVGGFKVVAEQSSEGIDGGERKSGGGDTSSAMKVRTFNQSLGDAEFLVWEKIGAVVRLSYGIGIYGTMALAGRFVCSITGTDCTGGFEPSLDAIVEGPGYASLPITALLFVLDDEVVKVSPHARAIRDVEDEDLRSFFYGMSPWKFILIVAASSVGEELFYRAAVQGGLADIFLRGTDFVTDACGMVSLTGDTPFVPFA